MNMTWLVVRPGGPWASLCDDWGGNRGGGNGRGGGAGFASGFCETNPATERGGFCETNPTSGAVSAIAKRTQRPGARVLRNEPYERGGEWVLRNEPYEGGSPGSEWVYETNPTGGP